MKELPYKKIYFVGIKGVGMASLAVIAQQAGYVVRGSDVAEKYISDKILTKNNIKVDIGFETEFIQQFNESTPGKLLVISTAAHGGFDNPQSIFAKERGLDILSFGQALGMFHYGTLLNRDDIVGLSVAGSHGKTTTSAMLATVLQSMGEDPSYLIGTSEAGKLGDAGHLGSGKYFVVESDEYVSDVLHDRVPKFHYQHPFGAIITNIDYDHPDVFKDVESIYEAFSQFVSNIQHGGILSILGDNPKYKDVWEFLIPELRVVTYGLQHENNYFADEIKNTVDGVEFNVLFDQNLLGRVTLPVIGVHNAVNALSVIALLHGMGFPFEKIVPGLSNFTGTTRRLELKGTTKNNVLIVDDYAHHPAEIIASLNALRKAYSNKKIVCIFQPHTFSRTEKLIEDFASAFTDADKLLLLPIFSSAREGKSDPKVEKKLYDQMLSTTQGKFLEDTQSVVKYCTQNFNSDNFVIVTMGAGNVYKIGDELLNKGD